MRLSARELDALRASAAILQRLSDECRAASDAADERGHEADSYAHLVRADALEELHLGIQRELNILEERLPGRVTCGSALVHAQGTAVRAPDGPGGSVAHRSAIPSGIPVHDSTHGTDSRRHFGDAEGE